MACCSGIGGTILQCVSLDDCLFTDTSARLASGPQRSGSVDEHGNKGRDDAPAVAVPMHVWTAVAQSLAAGPSSTAVGISIWLRASHPECMPVSDYGLDASSNE